MATDKIKISGLRIFAYHGCADFESEKGQVFVVDLELGVDLSNAGESDNLIETVHYGRVADLVSKVMTAEKHKLIECAALKVLKAIFAEFDLVENIIIELKKPYAPISADFEYVSVTMKRERGDFS